MLGWLNYYGVKLGGNVQIAVTIVKVTLIAGIILAGLGLGAPHAPAPASLAPLTFSGFIAALVAALWAYDGWNNVSMVSSEIRNPQRNLPLALIGGTLCVALIYMLANWAYFHVLTAAEVGAADRVAAEMMSRVWGEPGAAAVSVAAMISIFAALNGSILTAARVPFAAAREGNFFAPLGRITPQYATPGVSIAVLTAWSCVLLLSGKYEDLFNLVIFASWILYGMTAASVIVLRIKKPDLYRPYRTWGYPIVPFLFLGGASILVIKTAFDRPRESFLGIGLILVGLPFFWYWKRRSTGR
jgi:APA family basic amino acid/polyamine antiporter